MCPMLQHLLDTIKKPTKIAGFFIIQFEKFYLRSICIFLLITPSVVTNLRTYIPVG